MNSEIERIRQAYQKRSQERATDDYSYQWHSRNPISYTFRQAQERAVITLLNQQNVRLENSRVLDIGCGAGGFLRFLCDLGALPNNLYGIDLMPDRIALAHLRCPPGMHLSVEEAQQLPFMGNEFDLISQFTVFSSILEQGLQKGVAQEMDRTLKPGGFVLWYDMQQPYPPQHHVQGISAQTLGGLFPGYRWMQSQALHFHWQARLAPYSWLLCELIDHLPGLTHTHLLVLLQKP